MHLYSLEKASSNLLENRKIEVVPRHMNGQFTEKTNKKKPMANTSMKEMFNLTIN